MFSRRECVKDAFIICPQGHRHKMTYVLDNTDDSDVSYLCSLLSKNDCDISIFWQSKFDRNYMQQEEPKVYDAFNCIVVALGTLFNLNSAVSCYQLRNDRVEFLEKCFNEGKEGTKRWIDVERENQSINYEKLANSIIASLYPQP